MACGGLVFTRGISRLAKKILIVEDNRGSTADTRVDATVF